MKEITMFEGQEVSVITDKGEKLINLVHTAKACGLAGVSTKAGGKYEFVRFDRVKEKLKSIQNTVYEDSSKIKQSDEITYILDEIENTDDRNSIYMSSWLSKRLALECHSEKAMRYKNFLVTLDEKREQGKLTGANEEVAAMVGSTMKDIIPVLAEQLLNKFAPVVIETKNQVKYMSDLLYEQSINYDEDRRKIKELIGLRSVNVTNLTAKIKEKIADDLGIQANAYHPMYIKLKNMVFREFKVSKWEDIPAEKYSSVYAFIDSTDLKELTKVG